MIIWFLANMAWASLFMLAALLIRAPVARLFGAGPAYALWLIPALRLLVPPLPPLASVLPAPNPAESLVVWVGEGAAPLPPQAGSGPWLPILLGLWILGAAALAGWQWRAYRCFLAELGASSRSLGAHRGLRLVESAAVQGPVALGLFDRRIVVPADFATRYSPAEQSLALDHEAIHHRRGDIWCNLAGLAVLAVNWFNPVAWFAFRAFRADQELACDAAVAAAASAAERHDYARALIKSASRPGLIAACPLNHADQLKRRLKMMKHHRHSRARMLGGSAAVLLLAGLGLAAGAPGLAQPEPPAPPEPPAHQAGGGHERVIVRTIHRDGASETTTERRDDDAAADHGPHSGRSERVIVMTHRGEHHGEHPGEHRVEIRRDGGEIVIPDCENGARDEVNEGSEGNRTRIVLCSRGEASPAERAERLQRARDRLANDDELSAEQKARITAALDRRIAELRGR